MRAVGCQYEAVSCQQSFVVIQHQPPAFTPGLLFSVVIKPFLRALQSVKIPLGADTSTHFFYWTTFSLGVNLLLLRPGGIIIDAFGWVDSCRTACNSISS
jgi:hypothetical protein